MGEERGDGESASGAGAGAGAEEVAEEAEEGGSASKRVRWGTGATEPCSPIEGVPPGGGRPRRVLLLLVGPPGAGKSTFAAGLAQAAAAAGGDARTWTVVCQDTASGRGTPGTRHQVIMRVRACLEQSVRPAGVVVDRNHLSPAQREDLWALAARMGAEACALVFVVPLHELERRVRTRETHPGGVTGSRGVAVLKHIVATHADHLKRLGQDLGEELAALRPPLPATPILARNNVLFARCDADLYAARKKLVDF